MKGCELGSSSSTKRPSGQAVLNIRQVVKPDLFWAALIYSWEVMFSDLDILDGIFIIFLQYYV